jgi:hypothetical protein
MIGREKLTYRRDQICKQQNSRIKYDAPGGQPGRIPKPASVQVHQGFAAVYVVKTFLTSKRRIFPTWGPIEQEWCRMR